MHALLYINLFSFWQMNTESTVVVNAAFPWQQDAPFSVSVYNKLNKKVQTCISDHSLVTFTDFKFWASSVLSGCTTLQKQNLDLFMTTKKPEMLVRCKQSKIDYKCF